MRGVSPDILNYLAKGVTYTEKFVKAGAEKSTSLKKPKYGNKKCEWDGIIFDSKKELARYQELVYMERAKVIKHLCRQIPFVLIPKGTKHRETVYILDHYFVDEKGVEVYEDVKGFDKKTGKFRTTADFEIKKKLMFSVHKINITLK